MMIRLDRAFCLLSQRLKALAEGRAILVATANRPYALFMDSAFALHHQDPDALLLGVSNESVVARSPEFDHFFGGDGQFNLKDFTDLAS